MVTTKVFVSSRLSKPNKANVPLPIHKIVPNKCRYHKAPPPCSTYKILRIPFSRKPWFMMYGIFTCVSAWKHISNICTHAQPCIYMYKKQASSTSVFAFFTKWNRFDHFYEIGVSSDHSVRLFPISTQFIASHLATGLTQFFLLPSSIGHRDQMK